MKFTALILSIGLGVSFLSACDSTGTTGQVASEEQQTVISGTFSYRERMALVPGFTAVVTLEDISLADAPSKVLAEQKLDLDTLPMPYPFQLSVGSDELVENMRYSVRVKMLNPAGKLAWTTTETHPIDPLAGDQNIGLLTVYKVGQ